MRKNFIVDIFFLSCTGLCNCRLNTMNLKNIWCKGHFSFLKRTIKKKRSIIIFCLSYNSFQHPPLNFHYIATKKKLIFTKPFNYIYLKFFKCKCTLLKVFVNNFQLLIAKVRIILPKLLYMPSFKMHFCY